MSRFDVLVIGAGIAGAGVAHALLQRAPGLRVALLEAEAQPGYHTTGRSAAFFAETYGGPLVQPLSTASRSFLADPPPGFADPPILKPRGALHVCHVDHAAGLRALEAEFRQGGVFCRRLGPAEIAARVPQLREAWRQQALFEPGCTDIDVAALHQGFLRSARRGGAELRTHARVRALRRRGGGWRVETATAEYDADRVVNAAGAWAGEVAALAGALPFPVRPLRRTIVEAEMAPAAPGDLPLVLDSGGSLYFKPEHGRLWISPHDETPDVARDVVPEELDVALAVERFRQMCDWPLLRVAAKWAGLRNFSPDRLPVYGADPLAPGFFWCAGQGGWGIQTSPAASDLAAAAILGLALPDRCAGIDPTPYLAARFC